MDRRKAGDGFRLIETRFATFLSRRDQGFGQLRSREYNGLECENSKYFCIGSLEVTHSILIRPIRFNVSAFIRRFSNIQSRVFLKEGNLESEVLGILKSQKNSITSILSTPQYA